MDVREKLVELVNDVLMYLPWGEIQKDTAERIVDRMLDHDVTVQKWISINDRLPDKNTTVIVATDKGIVFQCLYAYDGWDLWDGNEINITHWQPMPEAPKGE